MVMTYTVAVKLAEGVTFLDLQAAIVQGLPGVLNVELIEAEKVETAR